MSALVVALLVAPVVVAVGLAVLPAHARTVGAPTAAALAVGWAIVAAGETPVSVGDLEVDAFVAAAAVGVAVLALATLARPAPPAGAFATAASLLATSALPAAAALDTAALPDRRLAGGVVLVALLAAARAVVDRGPRLAPVVVVVAGLVVASGLVGEDAGEAVALAAAGTLVAVVAAAVWGGAGRLVLPAALLALLGGAQVRPPEPELDVVLLVVAALVVVGAGVLVLVRARPATERLPLAGVLAAAGLLALDVPDLRAAGALLAAGAVLALAAQHPVALLALAPGLAAAVQSAGLATEPEHAAVGAAAVVALAAGAVGRLPLVVPAPGPLAVVVALTAAVPVWGWSGADTGPYQQAVAVTLAVALPVLVATALAPARHHLLAATPGRIALRPAADPSHGTAPLAEPPAEAGHQEEAGTEAP